MLVTRARVPWFQIWTCYWFMRIIFVLDLTCKLFTHIIVRNPGPQSDINWDNRRGWLWCEDHVCSWSVNALLWCFIKRSTLITSRFPWGHAGNRLVGQKMLCKFSLRARATIYGTHAYGYLVLGYFIIVYMHMPMSCLLYESSYPCNDCSSIPIPIVSQSFCLLRLLLLSLFHRCFYFTTTTTIKLLLLINCCEQVYFQVQLNWQLIC